MMPCLTINIKQPRAQFWLKKILEIRRVVGEERGASALTKGVLVCLG